MARKKPTGAEISPASPGAAKCAAQEGCGQNAGSGESGAGGEIGGIGENGEICEIRADAPFAFACGPHLACFTRCCADLDLPLTPYDVVRLRKNLGMSGTGFLLTHTAARFIPQTGLPLPRLRMREQRGSPCPFAGPAGCSVYADRPGACRCFPLGRGARIGKGGVTERFFLIREAYCLGFGQARAQRPARWLEDQGMAPYTAFNDRYMRLNALVAASGKALDDAMARLSLLALYETDSFRALMAETDLPASLDLPPARMQSLMEESPAGDAAILDFALDWLEFLLFGARPWARP